MKSKVMNQIAIGIVCIFLGFVIEFFSATSVTSFLVLQDSTIPIQQYRNKKGLKQNFILWF